MWHVLICQVQMHRHRIDFTRSVAQLQQRLELAAEIQPASVVTVEHGFLTKPVTSQQQSLSSVVPQSEREHPPQPLHAIVAILFVEMDDDFGVAGRCQLMPAALQFSRQFAVVVDLAIENDLNRAVFIADRLTSAGQVDDRQSTVTQHDACWRRNPVGPVRWSFAW